jgi:UbiD family decarboxylase
MNILGSSLSRIALTLGLPTPSTVLELIEGAKDIFKRRIPPIFVDKNQAPINENLLLDDSIDLAVFPALRMWPNDGGAT